MSLAHPPPRAHGRKAATLCRYLVRHRKIAHDDAIRHVATELLDAFLSAVSAVQLKGFKLRKSFQTFKAAITDRLVPQLQSPETRQRFKMRQQRCKSFVGDMPTIEEFDRTHTRASSEMRLVPNGKNEPAKRVNWLACFTVFLRRCDQPDPDYRCRPSEEARSGKDSVPAFELSLRHEDGYLNRKARPSPPVLKEYGIIDERLCQPPYNQNTFVSCLSARNS